MSNITYAFAANITKAEKTADGHLMVQGKAAGPELDLDGQICDPAWLKTAMPDWHRWGNVRAQHTAVAAGVGKELTHDDKGSWTLTAKVVDGDSKVKVEEGVYKGFSIGVKNARIVRDAQAPKGRIVGGDIVEISLVDRPCNPTATLAICKAAGMGSLEPVDVDGEIVKGAGLLEPDVRKAAMDTVNGVLDGDLLKELSESGDVGRAWAAIGQIADLIISEAEGLKSGEAHEIRDIEELLRAVRSLECFIDREEGEEDPDYVDMDRDMAAYKAQLLEEEEGLRAELHKAILADLRKGLPELSADDDDDPDDDDEADDEGDEEDAEPEKAYMTKVAGDATLGQLLTKVAGLEAQLQSAAELRKADAAKVEAMQAELNKFAGQPMPGGPRLVAPSRSMFVPEPVSAADRYRQMSQAPNLAPDVRAGLRELAEREESLAAS